jgi:hypothetical protein
MITNPKWWTYRKAGWGLAPKTWQAWVYIAIFLAIAFSVSGLAQIGVISWNAMMVIILTLVVVIIADTFHTMSQLGKVHDERENYHQLIIERNVSYAAVTVVALLAVYQSILFAINVSSGAVPNSFLPFDWELVAILIVMTLTKYISSLYVENKK